MPRTHPPYPPEFRQQIVDLLRAGRTPEELAREFEPSSETIRHGLKQADRDAGRRHDGLTTLERQELARLRRENTCACGPVQVSRCVWNGTFWQKPRSFDRLRTGAGSPGRPAQSRTGIRVRESPPGRLSAHDDGPRAGRLPQRRLGLG